MEPLSLIPAEKPKVPLEEKMKVIAFVSIVTLLSLVVVSNLASVKGHEKRWKVTNMKNGQEDVVDKERLEFLKRIHGGWLHVKPLD